MLVAPPPPTGRDGRGAVTEAGAGVGSAPVAAAWERARSGICANPAGSPYAGMLRLAGSAKFMLAGPGTVQSAAEAVPGNSPVART